MDETNGTNEVNRTIKQRLTFGYKNSEILLCILVFLILTCFHLFLSYISYNDLGWFGSITYFTICTVIFGIALPFKEAFFNEEQPSYFKAFALGLILSCPTLFINFRAISFKKIINFIDSL